MKRQNEGKREENVGIRIPYPNPLLRTGKEVEDSVETSIKKEIVNKVENFGLLYDKLIPLVKENGGEWKVLGKYKREFLTAIKGKEEGMGDILGKLRKRIEEEKEILQREGYYILVDKDFKSESRLVIGLGAGSVLETSLTLHKVWGIPYIPSTALKGILRMAFFWEIAREIAKGISLGDLQKMLDEPIEEFKKRKGERLNECYGKILKFKYLLGSPDYKGLLLFLDAYPLDLKFDVDVMNVHYPEYYSGKEKKARDDEMPNPIFFLTLAPGVRFLVVILFDVKRYELIEEKEFSKEEVKVEVECLIARAFKEFGVGAKTRVGYGVLGQIEALGK